MVKGFLIIDKQMNTILMPWDDEDLSDFLRLKGTMSKIRRHKTLKALDVDLRKYLKDEYTNDGEED